MTGGDGPRMHHIAFATHEKHYIIAICDKLDPVRRLAADFGINPATVKKAYDQLVADGLVDTAGRSGTVVRPGARTAAQSQQLDEGLTRVAWLARAQGFTVSEIRDHLDAILKELCDMNLGTASIDLGRLASGYAESNSTSLRNYLEQELVDLVGAAVVLGVRPLHHALPAVSGRLDDPPLRDVHHDLLLSAHHLRLPRRRPRGGS